MKTSECDTETPLKETMRRFREEPIVTPVVVGKTQQNSRNNSRHLGKWMDINWCDIILTESM